MLISDFEKGFNLANRVVWSIDILVGAPEGSIRYLKQISHSMMLTLGKKKFRYFNYMLITGAPNSNYLGKSFVSSSSSPHKASLGEIHY